MLPLVPTLFGSELRCECGSQETQLQPTTTRSTMLFQILAQDWLVYLMNNGMLPRKEHLTSG